LGGGRGRCVSLLTTSLKRYLFPGEREVGRRERAVLEKNRRCKYEHLRYCLGSFSFNETFVHIAGGISGIIKSSRAGKLENARNVFWKTSFEYMLLPTAVYRPKSLKMDLDTFPTNYK